MSKFNGMDVKREIIGERPKDMAAIALLSGFARSCLSFTRRPDGSEFELCLDCQTDFVRDYITSLMKDVFKVLPREDGAPNTLTYADLDKLMRGLYLVDPRTGDFYEGVSNVFFGSAYYTRGVFLGCGSMSAPHADDIRSTKSIGYHLEFSFNSESLADSFITHLAVYEIAAHKALRGEKCIVYVKDSESVSDCLALIGANKSVLRLNESVAALAVKRDIVRRVNCEVANMGRTARASVGIIEAIELIDKRVGLGAIDKKLADAAKARLEDPEAPLSEVADKLSISKSGLKHRLDRLIELARQFKSEE